MHVPATGAGRRRAAHARDMRQRDGHTILIQRSQDTHRRSLPLADGNIEIVREPQRRHALLAQGREQRGVLRTAARDQDSPDGLKAHVAGRLGDNGTDRRRDRFAGGSSEIAARVTIGVVIGPVAEFVARAERTTGPRLFSQAPREVGQKIRPHGPAAGAASAAQQMKL